MKNQHLIDNLSTSEKADLFQHLYAELAGQGTDGDTELAHVNRFEAQVLRNIGGSGTVNKVTGLRQYGKGGGSAPPPPAVTTTKNVPEYAPEQREYITDIFGKSQELYEQRMGEGYQAGPGNRMADWDPRETEAFTGMAGLARGPGAAPAYEIARQASLGAAAPITAAEIQQGMNPYQQAVTDIGKREAVRQYQRGPQAQLRSGAVESGGLRGARRFIEEGEGQRNLNQQLSDMQTMGSDRAYQQSMAEAAASRGRLANLATQMPGIGQGAYDQQMRQYGQLGGVGEVYRQREQDAINLSQNEFLQQQGFDEEQLGRYLRFITNAPSPSGFQQTTQAPGISSPGWAQQLAGLGLSGAAAGKAFNLFSRGGAVPPASGRRAGLSGIVRRAGGGQIVRMQDGGGIFDRIANYKGVGDFLPSTSKLYEGFKKAPIARNVIAPVGQFLSGTLSDVYDIAGEGVEYLTGIKTPSATEAYMNLGLSREQAAAMAGEGKGAVSRSLGDPKSLVGEGSTRMSDLVLPDGSDVGDYEETVAYKAAPAPKKQTPTDQVKKDIEKLNTRTLSEPKPETGTISDAGYLDIAAAALAGMSATDPAGTPQTTLGQLSKVLSPAASAAASGMRDADKTAREQRLLDMAITKETREATSAGVVDKLRQMQTETERLKPGTDKAAARAKYIQGIGQLVREDVLDPEQARALLMPYLNTSTARSGGSNVSASQRRPGS
jgi:hypothetical protein